MKASNQKLAKDFYRLFMVFIIKINFAQSFTIIFVISIRYVVPQKSKVSSFQKFICVCVKIINMRKKKEKEREDEGTGETI